MKCTKAQELFSAYMENTMDPPLRVVFEQHLAQCPKCKANYEKFHASIVMLEELPAVEVPHGFHAAVMARVERERMRTPSPVRWWKLDWQRALTIRVPVRAAAMGFAALLLMVMVFRLTPATTVVADWLGVPRAVNHTVGDGSDGPKISQAKAGYHVAQSGISISVKPDDSGTYQLGLTAKQERPIYFCMYMMPDDVSDADAAISTWQTGYVRQDECSTTRIGVDESIGARVVKVGWSYNHHDYNEYVFLPSHFDQNASAKSLELSIDNMSIYDALKLISRSYGIVIMASGDLNKKINYTGVNDGAPEDALYRSVIQAKMTWQAVDSSIYLVEPGD
ncbi:zf-HC2 domain-containing protein [bacterium]|nr:zf-HC2 domain-containing protein [bacterium]